MFCKRTTVSVIFILLIAEVFHHCSAEDDTKLPSIPDQPPPGLGLGSMISAMPFESLNLPMMMEQLLSMIKMLNESVSQMRQAMGLDENGQSEDQ